MNNATDPRQILDQSEMTRAMIIVVIITVFLNAMDGFDVLAISFAAPGIAAEWGISNAALGFVLSAANRAEKSMPSMGNITSGRRALIRKMEDAGAPAFSGTTSDEANEWLDTHSAEFKR